MFVSPFVPNCDTVFVQITNVRVTAQKPEQFVNDRFDVEFFRRQQRECLSQIEPRLGAEDR